MHRPAGAARIIRCLSRRRQHFGVNRHRGTIALVRIFQIIRWNDALFVEAMKPQTSPP